MIQSRNRFISRPRKADSRTGAAVVEFAIVANVMFVMVFTCMEFARMNMVRNLVQDAAYAAARHVIVPGATSEEGVAEAERIMSSMLTSGYTVDISSLDFGATEVTATVSVDLDHVALFVPMFLSNTNFSSTARVKTERYEGFYRQE
jgi:Flp pilus assembly protein TadG